MVEACALGPDLKILPGGDETEIGEKVTIYMRLVILLFSNFKVKLQCHVIDIALFRFLYTILRFTVA